MYIGRVTTPIDDQTELVQDKAELAADDPAMVRFAFLADLARAASFAHRMQQLNAVRVSYAQQGRLDHKAVGPGLMRLEQPEQACPIRQARKEHQAISLQPAIECSLPHSFERKQNAQGNDLARVQIGLTMFGNVLHRIIYPAEQFCDKIKRR